MRDYWRGEPATLGEFASRLTGSSDLYEATGRRPSASINFVTAHDGFTLADLVSYNEKHNEANGEDNRDGESHNRSWNCGVEGPTDDPEILALRARQMRNVLATLMVSQGTPMISHGDEIGRTQHGNNNVYCQDSELAWMDWSLCETNADLMTFTRRVTALRKDHPVFRRRRFFDGKPIRSGDDEIRDIAWLTTVGDRDDTAGLEFRIPVRRGVPQRRRDPRARTRAASGWSTTPSCCASTRTPTRRIRHARRRRLRRRVDGAARHGASDRRQRPGASRPASTLSLAGTVDHRPAQDGLTHGDCRSLSTYRLQMRGPRAGRRSRSPTRSKQLDYLDELGVSPPVPVADPDRRRGFHPRLRRHRPHHGLRRPRRRRGPGPAVGGGAGARAWA